MTVWIEITDTKGSAPRDAGTVMKVTATEIQGTIGGGALEYRAIGMARDMIARDLPDTIERMALGPGLGQCCGGAVTLRFSRSPKEIGEPPVLPEIIPTRRQHGGPVWTWGAGHVGRAIVDVLSSLPDLEIAWIDTATDRFPDTIPPPATRLIAADPTALVQHAPDTADHLILTYSHEIDLALCHALLSRPFGSVGLIGSATKWARFRSRLAQLGHTEDAIARINCPIGDPSLGKHPSAIAVGVAACLMGGQSGLVVVGERA